MGSCPHCEFTGKADVEELSSHNGENDQFYRGQLVCPDCSTILGAVQSYGIEGGTDDGVF